MEKDYPDLLRALVTGWPGLINGEQVVVGSTLTTLSGITAGFENPANLKAAASAGFVRFTIVDDPQGDVTRSAVVDMEVFALTYSRGMAIAMRSCSILLSVRKVGGVILDRRSTPSGPKEVRWDDDDDVRRFVSTHRISTRR
jgi:hypothetical protein